MNIKYVVPTAPTGSRGGVGGERGLSVAAAWPAQKAVLGIADILCEIPLAAVL